MQSHIKKKKKEEEEAISSHLYKSVQNLHNLAISVLVNCWIECSEFSNLISFRMTNLKKNSV